MSALDVIPSGEACGATVRGADLARPLSDSLVADIRAAWLAHHVLRFPAQRLDDDALERFTRAFGPFGDDPFIAPVAGRRHVIAVHRAADETGPIFAESWHTDWSFLPVPPAGTCLYGVTIPPTGGDTLFANQHRALEEMPAALRARIEGRVAIHSARAAYAPDGLYGRNDAARAMPSWVGPCGVWARTTSKSASSSPPAKTCAVATATAIAPARPSGCVCVGRAEASAKATTRVRSSHA